jgi:hypothetical protein
LFKSSSDAEEIASSGTGSGGTMVGSATGSGGAGGRDGAVGFAGGGGGAGRATGGFLPPQATAAARDTTPIQTVRYRTTVIVDLQFISTSPASRCCRSG